MKRLFKLIAAAAVCVVVFYITKTTSFHYRLVYAQTQQSAFKAERWAYLYSADGTSEVVQKEITAVDNNGSLAILSTPVRLVDRGFVLRRIKRVDGYFLRTNEVLKLVATGYDAEFIDQLKQRALVGAAGCIVPEENATVVGKDRLFGVDVVILRRDIAKGARMIRWEAPSLGCFAIQRIGQKLQPDGVTYKPVSEYKTVSLTLEQPSPDLFVIQPDFVETKPSDMEKQYYTFLGIPFPNNQRTNQEMTTLDSDYADMRAKIPK